MDDSFTFSNRCKIMNVCGTSIIGCPDTGTIIGLDDEGERLARSIYNGQAIGEQLNENQTSLLNALIQEGYFNEEPPPANVRSAYLHVTSHCNLNCDGCYSYENERNKKTTYLTAR